jgi:predicted dehydrogenase
VAAGGSGAGPGIRLAIVGAGGMARRHVESWERIAAGAPGLFTIVAVCDQDEARARHLAGLVAAFQPTPPVYADVGRLLDEARPDAVDVVLPHFLHHTVVVECLGAGAHVLAEKPVALSIRAGRLMIEAAERAGRVLAIAEQFRRSVEARTLNWAINRAGLIGTPRMLFAQDQRYAPGVVNGTPWRHDRLQAGGGWVLDHEIHHVDLLRYLFGEVAEVYARIRAFESVRYLERPHIVPMLRRYYDLLDELPPDQRATEPIPVPSTVEDSAVVLLTFASGLLGTYTFSHATPGEPFSVRRYYGSEGSIEADGLTTKDGTRRPMTELRAAFLASLSDAEREALFPLGLVDDDIAIELHDFLTAVRDGRRPEIDGLEALRDLAVCEAAYESDLAGVPIRVSDVLEGRVAAYQRPIDERWGIGGSP